MASIYKRTQKGQASRYWWICFRDPRDGKIKRESTKLKFDSTDTRRARQLEAEYTYRESQIPNVAPSERWDHWVEGYLDSRYGAGYSRAKGAWRNLRMFLKDRAIVAPRQLLREHCMEYVAWRAKPNKSQGKYRAGANTILLEIKFLSIIMTEAVLRRYAPFNPCRDLHLKRTAGKQKPEYPRPALAKILRAARREPEPRRTFFCHSFLIARYHGVRISETYFNPREAVTFNPTGGAIISLRVKGGKTHTVNLHPKLFRLFRRLHRQGVTETYPRPKSPSKEWFNFLTRIGIKKELPGACFHSLRVTAATTFARKGVSEKKAMSYLSHASTTIHRSYVRLKPDDLTDCTDALN